MSFSKSKSVSAVIAVATIFFVSCTSKDRYQLPDHKQLAREYYQEDAQWYLDNIPFFEPIDFSFIRTA